MAHEKIMVLTAIELNGVMSRIYTSYYIKRPFKLVYNILNSISEVFNLFIELRSLRIVGLEGAAYIIQLGVFSSVRDVRTNLYHTILIDIYDFVF